MTNARSTASSISAGSHDTLALVWRIATALAIAYLLMRWVLLIPDQGGIHGVDARTYWSAPLDNPYPGPQIGLPGAYLYSPAFIEALTPLRVLPWEAFHALWTGLSLLALAFLVTPVGAALALTLLPFVFRDVYIGNIHLMLGAAMAIGMTWPAAWTAVLLTKVTPGIGLLWFAFRREWRALIIAVGVTLAIALVSFAVAPQLWFDWVNRLTGDTGTAGSGYMALLVARLALAAVLVAVAARFDRAWLVAVAATIAVPILWPDSLAMLLAGVYLIRRRPRRDTAAA
ncbi:MAG TPA: glycosyltransferase family 87 protein [Candidatus Limnocylindria bacterium]|nr:glycosyltransferase family 87 protein [Candidatus Limnocylindria bacterium]